jgi:hypothetical protein
MSDPIKALVSKAGKAIQFIMDSNLFIHCAGFLFLAFSVLWILNVGDMAGKKGDLGGFGAIAGIGTFCLGIGQWKSV